MSEKAKDLVLDVDFETARAIHRIVRGMHDGECPKCHALHSSELMLKPNGDEACDSCGFTVTRNERRAAMKAFAPVMEKNLEVFEEWRKTLSG